MNLDVEDNMTNEYIKRTSSTIPFGYELVDESSTYLKPVEEELDALQIAENMVVNEEVSLPCPADSLQATKHLLMYFLTLTSALACIC